MRNQAHNTGSQMFRLRLNGEWYDFMYGFNGQVFINQETYQPLQDQTPPEGFNQAYGKWIDDPINGLGMDADHTKEVNG